MAKEYIENAGGRILIKNEGNEVTFDFVFDSIGDRAVVAVKGPQRGGIDLTPANMNLQTNNTGDGIKFHLDPAMLKALQNAPGFVPVIINIHPMTDLQVFLGINTT
jgi:hypothetical protein